MPDAIFAHPRLAAIYDVFDGARSDLDAYVAIAAEFAASADAGLAALTIVDVGCGTGNLAVRLAALGLGHTVIGIDPAAASLAVARTKPHADAVTWIEGDATALPHLEPPADLAVMTGNVAQVFLTNEDWTRTVRAIAAALRPGGHFVFETRRPERRAWEEWAAETAPVVRDVPGVGSVEQRMEVFSVELPYVSFRYSYRFPDGAVVTSESTLRFREREELDATLSECGFDVEDVREAPDRMGKEYVFIARRRKVDPCSPNG
jgi:SAM-dependent methyltransferase